MSSNLGPAVVRPLWDKHVTVTVSVPERGEHEMSFKQPPLYYCASCGGYYPIGHFCD